MVTCRWWSAVMLRWVALVCRCSLSPVGFRGPGRWSAPGRRGRHGGGQGTPGPGVFGVEHRVDDKSVYVLVFQAVEDRGARRGGCVTSRAIRSFARCCDTDGAGLSMRSANSLTESSPSMSVHNSRTRVGSASMRKTSTTSLT